MRGETALTEVAARATRLGHVIAWVGTPQQQARLTDGLRREAALSFVCSSGELLDALTQRVMPVGIVILPGVGADGESTESVIKRIALARPGTAIVVWCPAALQYALDLRALTAAGAHQFLLSGAQDGGSVLRSILLRARDVSAAEQVMRRLASLLPAAVHPIVEAVLERPQHVTSIRELANTIGVHRKTLFNRCERAGGLLPIDLLRWSRLMLVAYHLEHTSCTVEIIALDLGYPSSTSLRNTLKRYTMLKASELRANGPIDAVVHALRRHLARDR